MSAAITTVCLLSHHASCSASNEQPPSEAVKRDVPQPATGERDVSLHARFDLNGNIHMPGDAAGGAWEEPEAPSCHGGNEAAIQDFGLRSQEKQHCLSQGK